MKTLNLKNTLTLTLLIIPIIVLLLKTTLGEIIENTIKKWGPEVYPAILLAAVVSALIAFSSIKTLLSSLLLQESIRDSLLNLFQVSKRNESIIEKNKYLKKLYEEIISDTTSQVQELASTNSTNILIVNNEFKRVQLIRHLFSSQINKEISAVTYDDKEYFLNFWGGLNMEQFIDVNQKASENGTVIKRIFIFNKKNFTIEKKNLLKNFLKPYKINCVIKM
jgi:hypothetical protein